MAGKKGAIRVSLYGDADLRDFEKARRQISQAEREFKKNAGGFRGSMMRMQDSVTGFVRNNATALAAGAAVVGAFTFKLVQMGEAGLQAEARTLNIAKSMGIFGAEAGAVADRLNKLSDVQARATGVDDDIIKSTQAKFLTFKELAKTADDTGGAFDRATTAALDLAAAGFGEATQNATQLGKALNDPIKGLTALSRAGVTFTEQEKDKITALVESGKMLEAQDTLLRAIETQVGGTAESTATASARMTVLWGQVAESIGELAVPAVEDFADELARVVEAYERTLPAARDWARTGDAAAKAAMEADGATEALSTTLAFWNERGRESIRTGEEQMSVWRKIVTPVGAYAYAQGKAAEETEAARQEVELLAGRMKGTRGPVSNLTGELDENAMMAGETAEEYDELTRAMDGTMVASDEMSGKVRTLTELNLDQQESTIRVRDAEARAAEMLGRHGASSDEYRGAVIDLERAKLRSKDATADLMSAEKTHGGTLQQLAKQDAYEKHLLAIRDAANKARDAISRAQRVSQAKWGRTGTQSGGGVMQYGAGGIVSSPTLAEVGERGHPEYVITTEPTYRSRSLALLDSLSRDLGVRSNSTTYQIAVDARGATDPAATEHAVRRGIEAALGRTVSTGRLKASMMGA